MKIVPTEITFNKPINSKIVLLSLVFFVESQRQIKMLFFDIVSVRVNVKQSIFKTNTQVTLKSQVTVLIFTRTLLFFYLLFKRLSFVNLAAVFF